MNSSPIDSQLWTLGVWTAKPSQHEAFKATWSAFAEWTAQYQPGASEAFLLQDPQQPHRFFSFGPWESAEAIAAWRTQPEFAAFVAKVRELCDDFQPNTLRLVGYVKSGSS